MSSRSSKGCGCLLLALSIVVLLVMRPSPLIITPQTKPLLEAILQPVLCQSGETLSIWSNRANGGPSQLATDMDFYCQREDILIYADARAVKIEVGLFFALQLAGFGVLIWDKKKQSNRSDGMKKKNETARNM